MKVAFLGLGSMGMPMALNIAKAGHDLTVWNRHPKTLDEVEPKPRVAKSIAEAVEGAVAAMTMLADDHALESVVHGGLLDHLPPGAVHVSLSTIGVDAAKRLAKAHQERGLGYVAAPVLGRPDVAAQGKLWVIAAGDPEAVAKIRPLLEAIGRAVTEFGPEPWRANLVKLANNMLLAAMMEAVGEACGLVRKAGIAAPDFMAVVNGVFGSPVYANYGGAIAAGKFDGPALFKAHLGLKDLRLVLAAAEELGMPLPTAGLAHDNLLSAVALGQGDNEWTAVARMAERRGGLE